MITKDSARVLVCIPTYNEKENLGMIVPRVLESLDEAHILVIDDNSPDGTGVIADRLSQEGERVHVLHRENKEGLGRAYIAGFNWALEHGYDRIIEFDADFSHNPAYLRQMVDRLERADVVVGSRRVPGGGVENWTLSRRLISAAGSFYAGTVLGVPIKDLTGGFNGFTRESLEAIDFNSIAALGYAFQIEIKYRSVKKGLRVEEMPIVFPDRIRGKSKMSADVFKEAMVAVLRMRLGL